MSKTVRCGLIQASCRDGANGDPEHVKKRMIDKHLALLEHASDKGVKITCLQELFYGPYFPAEQNPSWYRFVEHIPQGPTTRLMQEFARQHSMVLVVPIYEEEMTGLFYNTAAVIDADGQYLGKYRKAHIPHCLPGFWEKFYFAPGNLGFPAFETSYARIGVYICYDRHFPEGARALGLHGAEIVFIPSATTSGGHAEHLWELEQRAHAVANGYFVGTINRVGTEAPWNVGKFFGSSYFADPDGRILSKGSEDNDEVVIADLNLEQIRVTRLNWQFFRDRRPELYSNIVSLNGRATNPEST